jgi:hypothetical protein
VLETIQKEKQRFKSHITAILQYKDAAQNESVNSNLKITVKKHLRNKTPKKGIYRCL